MLQLYKNVKKSASLLSSLIFFICLCYLFLKNSKFEIYIFTPIGNILNLHVTNPDEMVHYVRALFAVFASLLYIMVNYHEFL